MSRPGRFFALLPIKPHAPPPATCHSFEFQPCGRTPQVQVLNALAATPGGNPRHISALHRSRCGLPGTTSRCHHTFQLTVSHSPQSRRRYGLPYDASPLHTQFHFLYCISYPLSIAISSPAQRFPLQQCITAASAYVRINPITLGHTHHRYAVCIMFLFPAHRHCTTFSAVDNSVYDDSSHAVSPSSACAHRPDSHHAAPRSMGRVHTHCGPSTSMLSSSPLVMLTTN